MSNLLSLNPLVAAQEVAEVYVVYNNQDYRMTLGTLVSLVTKARLGLDRVNNTADLEKPISQQTMAALQTKADVDKVVSLEAFNQLAESIQGFVSIDDLNSAIQGIQTTLQSYATKAEMEVAIAAAIQPLNQAIAQMTAVLQDHSQRLTLIEQGGVTGGGLTQAELDAAIAEVLAESKLYTDQSIAATNQSVNDLRQQVNSLSAAVGGLSAALAGKADKVHRHTAAEIDGLEDAIKTYVDQAGVVIELSPSDW